jgi:SAM-dependent methyltransferase
METLKAHWEKVFSTKKENEVSWFQPYPETSIGFLELFELPLDANIIDVGGGDSHFIDALLDRGYKNIWLLDISGNAINRARMRLGARAANVHFVESDVVDFKPEVRFDFWHDRAAFHFLTSEDRINRYVSIAENAINPDGYLILGTFSEKGPVKCSGLEIKQYTEAGMSKRFEKSFDRIKCIEVEHQTPFSTTQNFLFCSFRKKE